MKHAQRAAWTAAFLLTAACASAGWNPDSGPSPVGEAPGTPGARELLGVLAPVNSHWDWVSGPWFRQGDAEAGPWYVFVAVDGMGCLTDAATWALAQPGQWRLCPAGWRFARGQ